MAPAVYVAAALSGFTALGAEVVWTRQLSLLFGASVYTFSLILAVFLDGPRHRRLRRHRDSRGDRGSARGARRRSRRCSPCAIALRRVGDRQRAAALAADRAVPAERARDAVADVRVRRAALRVRAAAGDDPVGRELPADARGRRRGDFGGHVARINAINTAGALAGAIAFTLIGIPLLGSRTTRSRRWSSFAALSGAHAAVARPRNGAAVRRLARGRVVTAVALWIVPPIPGQLIAYGRSVNSWAFDHALPVSRRRRDRVGRGHRRHVGGARQFHIAGKVEASDMDIDMRLERMLGHVPALLHPNPKSILIVGVGAGVTAGALSIHPEVERIVICEIEPVVPRSARAYFGEENHHVFDDPRVQLVFDDARHFLQTTTEKFDIITSDPIHPWVRGAATLYSLEYLTLAKQPPDARRRRHAVDAALRDRRAIGEERDRHVRAGVSRHDVVESRSARRRLRPRRARPRRADADQRGGDSGAARRRAPRASSRSTTWC